MSLHSNHPHRVLFHDRFSLDIETLLFIVVACVRLDRKARDCDHQREQRYGQSQSNRVHACEGRNVKSLLQAGQGLRLYRRT